MLMNEDSLPFFYTLNEDKKVVSCSQEVWIREFDSGMRRVARTKINGCIVSTVFLGIDHGFNFDIHPIVFETMIFTRRKGSYKFLDEQLWRGGVWEKARDNHVRTVKAIKHKNLSYLKDGRIYEQG